MTKEEIQNEMKRTNAIAVFDGLKEGIVYYYTQIADSTGLQLHVNFAIPLNDAFKITLKPQEPAITLIEWLE